MEPDRSVGRMAAAVCVGTTEVTTAVVAWESVTGRVPVAADSERTTWQNRWS
jgi:hypothetical protein